MLGSSVDLFSQKPPSQTAQAFIDAYSGVDQSDKRVPLSEIKKAIKEAIDVPDQPAQIEWKTLKYEKLTCLLLAISIADKSLDYGFNFEKVPFISVMPPANSGISAGESPERISDPIARKEYEDAIYNNKILAATYRNESELRDQMATIINYTRLFVTHYFDGEENAAVNKLVERTLSKCLGAKMLIDGWKNGLQP